MALLTALISVNGAVAALLPVVVVIAVRLKRKSSQLLMPLVFCRPCGLDARADRHAGERPRLGGGDASAGVGGFGFFEFALVGVPLLAGTHGDHRPLRRAASAPSQRRHHAGRLQPPRQDARRAIRPGERHLPDARARDARPMSGAARSAIDLAAFPDLQLVAVQEGEIGRAAAPARDGGGRSPAAAREMPKRPPRSPRRCISRFARMPQSARGEETLFNRRSGLAEVVIPPRSGLIGETVFPGMVTESGDLIVLAVQRGGARDRSAGAEVEAGGIVLQAGDTMLLQGTWKALDVHLDDPDVLVVSSPELVRRQAVPMGPGARQADRHPARHGRAARHRLRAAGRRRPARRRRHRPCRDHERRAVLSRDRLDDGDPRRRDDAAVDGHGRDRGRAAHGRGTRRSGRRCRPYALLAGLFVLTAVMGQLISNTATALIVIPIGVRPRRAWASRPVPS